MLSSDFQAYYEKYKETGLPFKWDGNIITFIGANGTTDGLKRYELSDGRRLYYMDEYIYNGEKRLAFSNRKSLADSIETKLITFYNNSATLLKKISLNNLGDLSTNDGGNIMIWNGGVVVKSCTKGSTKKFKITVDDSGTISATEVTA